MKIIALSVKPYYPELYECSRVLVEAILNALCVTADTKAESLWETNSTSEINYCEISTIIIEMSNLANREERKILATPAYQYQMEIRIAGRTDVFFGGDDES